MRIIKSNLPESDFGACRSWRDSIAGWCKSSCRHRAQFDRTYIYMRRTGKSLWRKCDKRRNCWLANQLSARRSGIQERANYLCISAALLLLPLGERESAFKPCVRSASTAEQKVERFNEIQWEEQEFVSRFFAWAHVVIYEVKPRVTCLKWKLRWKNNRRAVN